MPLYIRDEHINDLAEQLQRATGAATKSKAVQEALEKALDEARRSHSFEKIAGRALALARALPPVDPSFDLKRFTDEL